MGIAGHVLHGGYGRASRTHGLTLDWLIGATVILANGSMVHCSAAENKDLYWALRGAGSSFGIVVVFEFNTFEAPESVTPFTINLPWNKDKTVATISELQAFAASTSEKLNIFAFFTATSQVIQGLYFGDSQSLKLVLQPLLARLESKVSYASTMGWLQGLEHYADKEALNQTYPYNAVCSNP